MSNIEYYDTHYAAEKTKIVGHTIIFCRCLNTIMINEWPELQYLIKTKALWHYLLKDLFKSNLIASPLKG